MKAHRLARVAEAVREVASETILYELCDPRIKMVTVTRAEVSSSVYGPQFARDPASPGWRRGS